MPPYTYFSGAHTLISYLLPYTFNRPTFHLYCYLCGMRKLSMDELNRKSVQEFKESPKIPVIAVLENVRSAHNVGSVLRTADAFLLEAVYTTGYTAHPPHKEISKTALGADESVTSKHFANAAEAITELKEQGYKVLAIEQAENSHQLHQFLLAEGEKLAVVFGNEVSGVEQSTILLCDGCIEIPQLGMKHSLNISVAAGIVLWEIVRTRIVRTGILKD
jgi:23S rRNA (guanosine2251-2'-O)-methyltransferase